MSWFLGRRHRIDRRLDGIADRVAELVTRSDELAARLARIDGDRVEDTARRQHQLERIEAACRDIADVAANGERDRARIAAAEALVDEVRAVLERRDDAIDRLRMDLLRAEEQARIDLAEYRTTTAAIVLATLPGAGAQPTATIDAAAATLD